MTTYYVRHASDGMSFIEDFWAIDDGIAHQGIIPSQLGTHTADPGEDIMTLLEKRFPGSQFHRLRLGPGEYFPRMARPGSVRQECSPGHNPDRSKEALITRTTSTGQLHALIQELQQICRVVHPIDDNFDAYGHEIRNLLIIACTEVEAHWKNILVENGARSDNRHNYVKLSLPMKLGAYRVAMPWYPWLDAIAPFEHWVPTKPGEQQDLPWYDAYNAVKHDREKNFAQAKLIHAIEAVSGCFVMLCAQYGWSFARRGPTAEDVFFQLIGAPQWEPSEIYVPPIGTTVRKRHYQFDP